MTTKKTTEVKTLGADKPQTTIKTNVEQTGLKKAKPFKKKVEPAVPQKTDVYLRAGEGALFHEPGEEFYATRVVADKLIKSNQAEEIPAPSDDENEEA